MTREDRGASSFDELAVGLSSGTLSRGRALRLMGAALVGGTLASLGIREAAADECKRIGKVCKKDAQCCSGNCVKSTCSACPAGRILLSNGTCAKPCAGDDCPGCAIGCFTAVSGNAYCLSGAGSAEPCTSDSTCRLGEICVGATCAAAC
jgi:hypothetical protein